MKIMSILFDKAMPGHDYRLTFHIMSLILSVNTEKEMYHNKAIFARQYSCFDTLQSSQSTISVTRV